MVFPVNNAGASFLTTIAAGKFQGVIATTMPYGTLYLESIQLTSNFASSGI